MKYYIVGGQQKGEVLKDWQQYKKGLIIKADPVTGKAQKCLEYQSPLEVSAPGGTSTHFTAASIQDKVLYVGTQTEILKFSLPNFEKLGYVSLPIFNDIHHVLPLKNGNLLIVNTGLDMVVEIEPSGKVIHEWGVIDDPWKRFSREVDYRKIPSTKPHKSHPNYVFTINDDIFVTRCHQHDAICLTDSEKKIQVGTGYIHDGLVYGDSIYFTQVNGHVIVVDKNTLKVKEKYNLNRMTPGNQPPGWTRGIHVLDERKIIVGFSRIRPSRKTGPDGKIMKNGGFGVKPTRFSCYDVKNEELLWELPVEQFGLNAIFSIHPA